MFDRLANNIGKEVVVDYTSNSSNKFYAKGYLIDVSDQFIFIRSYDGDEEWYIHFESILNLKLKEVVAEDV